MRRLIRYSLAIMLGVAIGMLCRTYLKPQPSAMGPALDSPFISEQHWLVHSIVTDLHGMLSYAKNPAAPPDPVSVSVVPEINSPGGLTVTVSGIRGNGPSSLSVTVPAGQWLWSPDNFEPLAREMAKTMDLSLPAAPAAVADTNLLSRLQQLTAQRIEEENQRVSRGLSRNMLDASLHEQAALLLGGFALREAAGPFSDIRRTLCRMCAHLTMARVLGAEQPGDLTGPTAEAMLLTLIDSERDALDALGKLKESVGTNSPAAAWIRALTIRNTGDWRLLSDPSASSLLEQLEYFRALTRDVSSDVALDFLRNGGRAEVPDWGRIVLASNFSVGSGHTFTESGLPMEFAEFAAVWNQSHSSQLQSGQFIEALNALPGNCVGQDTNGAARVAVIDWGGWAGFSQRHICHQVQAALWFVRDKWSVKERADAYWSKIQNLLSGLTLFPMLAKRAAQNEQDYRAAMRNVRAILVKQPELFNAANWTCLCDKPDFCSLDPLPDPNDWFVPALPQGTAFDAGQRFTGLRALATLDRPSYERLHAIAPYSYNLDWYYLHNKDGDKPSAADARAVYGALCDYDVSALWRVADTEQDQPEQYENTLQQICLLDPDQYFPLGDYLVKQKKDEQAALAYQKGVDLARDSVRVCNQCGWLVNYYYDHGRRQDALQLAQQAAEVYCEQGLEIMAHLSERMGKLDDAEDYNKQIRERYDNTGPLAGFYYRGWKTRSNVWDQAKFNALAADVFPKGVLVQATLADFSGPPRDGTRFTSSNDTLKKSGLDLGDVVVALDGFRVHTDDQYRFVRGFSADPRMDIIAWHRGKYIEITPELRNRRFGVEMKSYQPR